MKHNLAFHWRRQLVWGILLIVLGSLLLMGGAGILDFDLDMRTIWHYWPVPVALIGLTRLIPPTTPNYILKGLWEIGFAGWWYVSFEHVWGLSFRDTWPFFMVAWGVGMVLRPALNKIFYPNMEQ